jgi:surface protein
VISISNSNVIGGLPANLSGGAAPSSPDFISTWDTTQAGSASDTIVLPMTAGVATVDWGDGTINTANTHTYASGGIKTITISGTIEGFQFNNGGDDNKIIEISNWGTFNFTTNRVFFGCVNLVVTATDAPIVTSTSFGYTFYLCYALGDPDFSNWDMSSNTDFTRTFGNSGNPNISGWVHSGVTTIQYFFLNNNEYNRPITDWDLSGCTNAENSFSNADAFNSSIAGLSFGTNCTLTSMFQYSGGFTGIGIESVDFSNVSSLNRFLSLATSFAGNITTMDTSNVTSMPYALHALGNTNIDPSNWTISQVTSLSNFATSTTFTTAVYDALLIAWDAQGAMSYSGTVNFGGSQYSCRAEAARTSLISKWGGITDGGLNTSINCNFVSTWDTTQTGSASDTIVLPMTAGVATVDWGDGTIDTSNTHTYAVGGIYTLTMSGTINTFRFSNSGDKLKITDISNWGSFELINNAFSFFQNLDISATDAPIITTTNLQNAFKWCTSLTTPDFSNFDTSSVTIMETMFEGCSLFNGNVTTWDVSNVTKFGRGHTVGIFSNCLLFNQDIGGWDTSSALIMNNMLPVSFDQDVSSWDINQATRLAYFKVGAFSTANYDALLIAWDAQGAMSYSGTVNFGTSQYTSGGAAEAARTSLIAKWGGITDGGAA